MQHTTIQRQFNPDHPKYFCCCGCHVMTGTKIIASIYSVLIGLWALKILNNGVLWSNYASNILSTAFAIACIACLWIGVLHERAGYLIPFMVYTVLSIGVTVVVFVLVALDVKAFKRLSYMTDNKKGGHYQFNFFGYFLVVIGIVCLHVLSIFIVKKTYSFIQHKRYSAMYQFTHVHYMQQELVVVPKESAPPPPYEWQQQL
uniref:Uncharacterized protein n=1 Tax=Plectus sambesii TaxID=2011161 RepID=A0A914VB84_9BILA